MSGWIWGCAKSALFRIDPEATHHAVTRAVQAAQKIPGLLNLMSGTPLGGFSKPVSVFGIEFASRVGLAAGFDKNAEILTALPSLGFGFAEIGTVTPRPQAGNSPPRLFRDPSRAALFNRMGFNNLGSELIQKRLIQARKSLPSGFRVGVNLGKNKDTPNERAFEDYAHLAEVFAEWADYLVINVSSPNTPGLRDLQTQTDELKKIVDSVLEKAARVQKATPVLLKLAPEAPIEVISKANAWGLQGFVLTNTLGGTWSEYGTQWTGGWSGGPLTELSRNILTQARSVTRLPLISVGGILSLDEARTRISAGADLVQIYSGWIFEGPRFGAKLSRGLSKH